MKLIHVCLIFSLSISLTGCRNNIPHGKASLDKRQATQAERFKDEISHIDNFTQIANDHKHSFTIVKTLLGTDEGGQLTGYYDGQVLTKIDVWLGMSNNALSQQFYFKNNHLIYVHETRKYYSWDQNKGEINRNQFSETKTQKYYFRNGSLIWHIPNEETTIAESDILSQARMYILLLSKKVKTMQLNQ